MTPMAPDRCPSCPVAAGFRCPGRDAPSLCRRVEAGEPGRAEQLRGIAEGNPTLLEKAANLARAAVAHVADGGRKATPEVQAARKAECLACPHLDQSRDACPKCGCILMGLKRSWASSFCPDKPPRWDAV